MIEFRLQKALTAATGEMLLDVTQTIEPGKVVALFGASGVGKTSILRMLAGLMTPDAGRIQVGEQVWFDAEKSINLTPQRRRIGFVFQDYALFPNMTVEENLRYALGKGQSQDPVIKLMETVELTSLRLRKPDTLSGGQKQRVALARAIVRQPDILLLDEPLSALDQSMRTKLQTHLLKVHRQFHLTTVLVTHDISEIIRMADEVLVLEEGRVARQGLPLEIFAGDRTMNPFRFSGEVVGLQLLPAHLQISLLVAGQVRIVQTRRRSDIAIGDRLKVVPQEVLAEVSKED